MSERCDDRLPLSAEEEAFVERLAGDYAPPPLGAAERARLDTELRERIATPRWRAFGRPAFTAVTVGLALGLALALGGRGSWPTDRAGSGELAADAAAAAAWERDLFDLDSIGDVDAAGDLDELPDDYAAIAGILLDG